MQALALRAPCVALRLSAVTFCHYAHHCIKGKVFVVLNAHALRAVRCVFLAMLHALSVCEREHVTFTCIHGSAGLCRCVVRLSLFHGAILRRIF